MSRAEIKARARAQLGNNIFGGNWVTAVLVIAVFSLLVGVINVIPGVGTLASIVISGPLTYGLLKLFLNQARDGAQMEVGGLFDGFKDDFAGTFLLSLLISIFTFLWAILFIIPGIVKSFSYSMSFFIKKDHPEYTWRQCIDESRAMMDGHKWELFVQRLSFIGWMFVGSLCLGIGTLWVMAYMYAADAQFYENLKGAAPAVTEA